MNELLTRIYSGQTQLFLLGEQIDFPDPDALFDRLFNSKSHANPFGYHNPVVDRLLMEAQATLDDEQRARLYGEIERMILDDHAILPLACVKYSYVHSRRFKDLEVNVLGFQYLPFQQVWDQTELKRNISIPNVLQFPFYCLHEREQDIWPEIKPDIGTGK